MPEENKLKIYAVQETCRFSEDDLQLVHDYYEDVIGDTKKIPVGKLIPKLFVIASQVAGQKVVPDLKVVEENNNLKIKLEELQNVANSNAQTSTGLQLEVDRLKKVIEQLEDNNRVLRESSEGCLLMQFDEKQTNFLQNALEIYKRDKQAGTIEEMLFKIITAFQGMGYLRFDEKDIEYLKSLKKSE